MKVETEILATKQRPAFAAFFIYLDLDLDVDVDLDVDLDLHQDPSMHLYITTYTETLDFHFPPGIRTGEAGVSGMLGIRRIRDGGYGHDSGNNKH